MSSKRYPEKFKIEAGQQVVDRDSTVADVAKRLNIATYSLYPWVKNTAGKCY